MTLVGPSLGLIGYDCASGNTNVTQVSLKDVGNCEVPDVTVTTNRTYLQLLQLDNVKEIPVIQCRVLIKRTVLWCGMHSHTSAVSRGIAEYVLEVDAARCAKIHETGRLAIGNEVLDGIEPNSTTIRSITLAGTLKSDGSCRGVGYSDHFGSWEDNVIVYGTATISISDYPASVNLDTNKIHLRGGVSCDFNRGHCSDFDGGQAFWERVPKDMCNFYKYLVLYEGPAEIGNIRQDGTTQVMFSVQTKEITFALVQEAVHRRCGFALIQTEHPKLFVLQGAKGTFFTALRKIPTREMDLFTYINSKFVYVEKHIHTQLNNLYRDVVLQRCLLEQKVLKNSLSLATIQPDQFAFDFMRSPGYMAVLGGETIYIIKCVAVVVKLRESDECYSELPVSKDNKSYFLTPRTRILKQNGIQINCNSILPSTYEIDGVWYRFMPKPTETKNPHQMNPNHKYTWEYKSIGNLATSGIYTQEDLDKLRQAVMFPSDRPAILNILARKASGQTTNLNAISLSNLLDKKILEAYADNAWNRFKAKYTNYGIFSAGIIMTLLIIKCIGRIVAITLNFLNLRAAFGCSSYLLSALCSGMTNYWLHRRNFNSNEQDPEASPAECMPLQEKASKPSDLNVGLK